MVVGKPHPSTALNTRKMLASAPVVSHTVFDKQSFKATFVRVPQLSGLV